MLALVTTSAFAAPSNQYDRREWRDYDGDDYFERDRAPYQRFDRTRWHRDFRSRWVTIANAYSATTNRQFIKMNGQTFDRLRIEAVRGAPLIKQVAVEYQDGNTQVVRLDERLNQGAGEVLRLNGVPINRVIVYTEPRFGGAYGLYAAQGRNWNRVGMRR
jgi:hypothetical protein